jgi:hypothetical protein
MMRSLWRVSGGDSNRRTACEVPEKQTGVYVAISGKIKSGSGGKLADKAINGLRLSDTSRRGQK